MIIYLYEVFIPKYGSRDSQYKESQLQVAVQNEELIVLSDYRFTTINKKRSVGSDLNKTLNVFHISEWKMGFSDLDGIHYTEYSDHKVRPVTIKNRISSFISEEYLWANHIKLDFIGEQNGR